MTIRMPVAAASRDLHAILDGIAVEDSPQDARNAALALRTAVVEGRIDGISYDVGIDAPGCCCVVGHIADALGRDWGEGLPGWTPPRERLSPLEYLVLLVNSSDRPEDTPELAALLVMVDAWLVAHGYALEVTA